MLAIGCQSDNGLQRVRSSPEVPFIWLRRSGKRLGCFILSFKDSELLVAEDIVRVEMGVGSRNWEVGGGRKRREVELDWGPGYQRL